MSYTKKTLIIPTPMSDLDRATLNEFADSVSDILKELVANADDEVLHDEESQLSFDYETLSSLKEFIILYANGGTFSYE